MDMYEPYNEIPHVELQKVYQLYLVVKNVETHDVESSKDLTNTFNEINGHPDVVAFC